VTLPVSLRSSAARPMNSSMPWRRVTTPLLPPRKRRPHARSASRIRRPPRRSPRPRRQPPRRYSRPRRRPRSRPRRRPRPRPHQRMAHTHCAHGARAAKTLRC
jgi:hypothetical protein